MSDLEFSFFRSVEQLRGMGLFCVTNVGFLRICDPASFLYPQ